MSARVVFVFALFLNSLIAAGPGLPSGTGKFVFDAYPPLADRPIPVWYWAPAGDLSERPIHFVMHGAARNADDYRDNWIAAAKRYGLLLIAPEFSYRRYPGSRAYNLGRMFGSAGESLPEDGWSYSAIEPLFDFVKLLIGGDQTSYTMFGHSAGAQFVHRFLWFKPSNRARALVAANAGWYTFPDQEIAFPYGLQGTSIDKKSLRAALERRLIVLLGDQDTDPNSRSLRRTPEALQQGRHRFARGHFFFHAAQAAARDLDADLAWEMEVVPGVAHDNAGMVEPAARLLYGATE